MFPALRLTKGRARLPAAAGLLLAAAGLLLAAAGLLLAPSAATAKEAAEASANGACKDPGLAMLASPETPWKGAPLRVLFAADQAVPGELSLMGPDGRIKAVAKGSEGGPPYYWYAEVDKPLAGKWQARLIRDGIATPGCSDVSREITVEKRRPSGPHAVKGSVWPMHAAWNRATENLYSAWIEKLFDAPLDAEPSWTALHEVLRDQSRNALYDYMGLAEDQKKLIIQPDCADLPYFLRAYFAFKMGLPYGYAKCTRGDNGKAPRCPQFWTLVKEEPPPAPPQPPQPEQASAGFFSMVTPPPPPAVKMPQRPPGLVSGFGFYLRTTIANGVQSGNGRTALDDSKTDFYPVPLTQATLRPGTIYADPYGHILVLVSRVPQKGDGAGLFFAVDGQPDGTVARKRFWRGNFLFATDPALGGPGFKRFRPIVREPDGSLQRLSNKQIADDPDYGDFSLQQGKLSVEQFYDEMDKVMSPRPLDPTRALEDAIDSLEEQVKTRVTSVENGRKYLAGGGAQVAMPDGTSIFETSGPWEDYATPSRDMRLLIAMDVVQGFPEHVATHPDRYKMPAGETPDQVKAQLEATLAKELATRQFSYTRSDGSQWTLTLKDVFEREAAMEMAYNINDCVELRWGAPDGSKEAATCKAHAPQGQREKMAGEYRAWFHDRTRPPRG